MAFADCTTVRAAGCQLCALLELGTVVCCCAAGLHRDQLPARQIATKPTIGGNSLAWHYRQPGVAWQLQVSARSCFESALRFPAAIRPYRAAARNFFLDIPGDELSLRR